MAKNIKKIEICSEIANFNVNSIKWDHCGHGGPISAPKCFRRPGEDRGKTGGRPGDGRGGHGGHFRSKFQPMFACQSAFIFFATSIVFVMYF